MSVSPQLLALMSVTPSRHNGVTSWSISMDFRYPFAWETVSSFVLRQKAKGPPDDMVTLEVDRNTFKYKVRMPWYARVVLAKNIMWDDIMKADPSSKLLSEEGININLQHLGTVRDMSTWRACKDDPDVTLYDKRVDFNIRMPVGPAIMMKVAQPLTRWFHTKSQLCRELEVKAIRDFLDGNAEDTEVALERQKQEDRRWMEVLTSAITEPPSPVSDAHAQEQQSSSKTATRMAAAKEKAKNAAEKAKAAGVKAAERSRSRAQDGSSVAGV